MTRLRQPLLNSAALAGRCSRSHLAPSPDLAPYVAVAWMMEWKLEREETFTQRVIPNPCIQIIVEDGGADVLGVQSGAFLATLRGHGFVLGLRFRPGGFHPFCPRDAVRLTDRRVPLAEIFPGAEVQRLRHLAARSDGRAIVDLLEALLRGAMAPPDARLREVREIADLIERDATLLTVEQAARASGMSKRRLQRLFRTHVGVSPKWMIRRYRLQEAAARVEAGDPPSWAELALRLGYFDQAHFVNDFTRMVGQPPGDYQASLRRA